MKITTQIAVAILGITLLTQVTFGSIAYWIIEDSYLVELGTPLLTISIIIICVAIALALLLSSIINRCMKQKNEELERLALYDKLTGLPNRTLLFDRLEQARARANRNDGSFALLVMDLDNFKEINDTLGHHFGDLMLTEISKNISLSLRESDSLARLGGDEFAILLHDTDEEGTNVCVMRIINKLKTPIYIEDTHIESRASIGVAIYPQHGEDSKSLLKHADIAMYQSKKTRKNYVVYDFSYDSYSIRNLTLMNELRKAVEHDQITAHYQPMIDQHNNSTVAIEALARWDHPELGIISPDEFIPVAEHIGVIQKLTFSILKQALQAKIKWADKGYNLQIAINISTLCFRDGSFPDKLNAVLQNAGVLPEKVKLELTESALMQDLSSARKILDELHSAGFIISIDDFGTGFSSMSYLKELPFDILKIDKSFIFDMDNSKSEAIVHSIIELAHNLDCKVIAEGVETEKALDHLRGLNNDIAQGYLFSRPLPQDEMDQWLEDSSWPPLSMNSEKLADTQDKQAREVRPPKLGGAESI
jgi:diguanylate cyclase (GGDEF)-like protein